MAKKSNKFASKTIENPMKSLFVGMLIGLCCSILTFTVLLFVFSAVALKNPDPSSLYFLLGPIASLVSAFIGGLVCAKCSRGSEILSSALCGCVLAVISFILGLFLCNSSSSGLSSFVFLIFPAVCLLAGLIGKPKKSKKKPFSKRS